MKTCLTLLLLFLLIDTIHAQVFDTIASYKKFPPSELHQDLDFLLRKFEKIHPDYFLEMPRDTVVKRYEDLKAQITGPMTRLDFMNLFSPVVFNVIKDGHNYVYGVEEEKQLYIEGGGKFFPFPVKIRDKRLYVNSTKAEIPFNAEIVEINGVSTKEVIEKVLDGYNGESDEAEESMFSGWFYDSYWNVYGEAIKYSITYHTAKDFSEKRIQVPGRTEDEIYALGITEHIKNYDFYELAEIETGVIAYNACEDLENFRPFCDSVFSLMRQNNYKNLIIDIRENVGGTTRLNDILFEYLTDKPITQFTYIKTKVSKDKKKDFVYQNRKYAGWFKWYHYLYYPIYIRLNDERKELMTAKNGTFVQRQYEPEKPKENPLLFKGNIYLLMGRKTYSSAACFAAAIKCSEIATIIGQETGEPTCFTADGVEVELPNTKLKCAISSKQYVLTCSKCDGNGVMPDMVIDSSNTGDDPEDVELRFAEKMIQKGRQ